jgi:hypothetical protein
MFDHTDGPNQVELGAAIGLFASTRAVAHG